MNKKLYVLGIGPGDFKKMTIEAKEILESSDIIIGYTTYIDLIKDYFKDKEFLSSPMKKEKDRVILALEKAREGKIISLVSSGDAGVYGMSGLVLELAKNYEDVEIEIIAGVSAAMSGAAVLGAPLMHDFAVISLSDLLTPMEKIEDRLRLASKADFVISIYNPSSKKRSDYLKRACEIMLEYKSEDTVCAVVKNIARENEEYGIMSLKELKEAKTDMFTTVFVGNSQTKVINNKMVTPRGYNI